MDVDPPVSVEVGALAEEEVDDHRCRADQKGGQGRDQNGPSADHRLLIVLRVHAEGPGRGADDQPDQGGDERPRPQSVDQSLQGAAPGRQSASGSA